VVAEGQETDGFESGFVKFEDSGDVFCFFGFEGYGSADLVVGPVELHLSDVFDLFPDGDVAFGPVEMFGHDGEVYDEGVVAVHGFFHAVSGPTDGIDEGACFVDSDGLHVIFGMGVVYTEAPPAKAMPANNLHYQGCSPNGIKRKLRLAFPRAGACLASGAEAHHRLARREHPQNPLLHQGQSAFGVIPQRHLPARHHPVPAARADSADHPRHFQRRAPSG